MKIVSDVVVRRTYASRNSGARCHATAFQGDDVINVFKSFEHWRDPVFQ
jgi:hypothetical protein